ncbi:unnamed protein product [Withania somnifera]
MEKNDVVPIELPAPPGWMKRFTPRKGGTPRRNDIVFVSPDGDEIKNKRQLDKYLKSHPGGPPASEFDWGTAEGATEKETKGEKSKATETPESDAPRKRQRKSSSKKGAKEDGDEQEAEGANEKETGDEQEAEGATERDTVDEQEAEGATEKETKGSDEPALPDAEDLEGQDVEITPKKVPTEGDYIKDNEEKNNDGEIVPEEPPASEHKMEIVQEKEETVDEGNIEKMEIEEAEDKPLDNSLKTDNKPLSLNVLEETKIESIPAGTDASSHSAELSRANSASQEESAEEAPATLDALNVVEENKIESKPVGADASSHSAELSKATSASQEETAEKAPVAADALNVLEENKIESKPAGTDASSHSAEVSKATSVSQEESAEEAFAAADPLVQNSNDAKVDKNEQIGREILIEEINGTEPAATGVNNSVENNSVQQEATIVDQVTSS